MMSIAAAVAELLPDEALPTADHYSLVNSIIHADCVHAMRGIPTGKVDFVLTDPPYLVQYQSRDGRILDGDGKSDWLVPAFREIHRTLKDDAFCVSFYGWHKLDLFMAAWRTVGFRPVGHFVAVKRYGSASGFVQYTHESAYLLAKGRPEKPRVIIRDSLPWNYTGNRLHPTQKPEETLEPLVRSFTEPGDLILDPFCGSGTTPAVAKRLGRRWIGIESNTEYAGIAAERLARVASPTHQAAKHAA